MTRKIIIFCFVFGLISSLQAKKLKVACIGNSVTYGAGLENREINCYPAQLQQLLGEDYQVENFGKNGATLLTKGHRPYILQDEYKAALAFAGDRIVIHLGLNDTDPRNWPNYQDEFISNYLQLIDSFRKVKPDCKIWICRMSPIAHRHPRFKSGTRDWYWQIQNAIERIASTANTGLIDLQEKLYSRPDLLPDALHPSNEGARIIAQTVYGSITGNYGGLQMPVLYSDNMVLQRNKPLSISGVANSGEKITVSLGKQKAETITHPNGKWDLTLSAMPAGGPYTLNINAPSKTLTYKNVLIGEVWLCSGQSNMAFMLCQSATGKEEIKTITAFSKLAHKQNETTDEASPLRFFDMKGRWITNATEWDASVLDSLNCLQYYHNTQWTKCTPETAANMSAIAYYFGRMLADSLQVPVGLIHNAIGGSPTESWIDRKTLEFQFPDILYNWTQNDMIQDWVRGRSALNLKKSANKQQRHPYEPCYLYEAGIEPLKACPIQGVLWYQGESNAHNIEIHERIFPLLVESWRKTWGKELPFYYVQLSSLNRPSWPQFRDSQRRMMYALPQTGMAVSSDKGDSLDVHPTQKKEIGERLARWALNKTYQKDIIASGPLFRSAESSGNEAYLTFDYGEDMHPSEGTSINTFEVAETDGLFFPATALVIDGKIKVSSPSVTHPRFVRYGWQPFTRANLVNRDGLPASTFRATVSQKTNL